MSHELYTGTLLEALKEAENRKLRLASFTETLKFANEMPQLLEGGRFIGSGTMAASPRKGEKIETIAKGQFNIESFTRHMPSSEALFIDPSNYRISIYDSGITITPFPAPEDVHVNGFIDLKGRLFSNIARDDSLRDVLSGLRVITPREESYVGPLITGGYSLEAAIMTFPPLWKYHYFLVPFTLNEVLEEKAYKSGGSTRIIISCSQTEYNDALHNARVAVKNCIKDERNPIEMLVQLLTKYPAIQTEENAVVNVPLGRKEFERLFEEASQEKVDYKNVQEVLITPLFKILKSSRQ